MGWTSYHATHYKNGKVDRKAECDAYFTEGLNEGFYRLEKSTMIGSVYYAAVAGLKRYNGEKQEDVDLLKKDIVLKNQIKKALVDIESVDNIIIAYEPVWSVGTNKVPSNKEISDTVNYIKQIVFNKYHKNIKVLYGGSINEKNIEKFNEIRNISGYLIGSASIEPSKFLKIINKVL